MQEHKVPQPKEDIKQKILQSPLLKQLADSMDERLASIESKLGSGEHIQGIITALKSYVDVAITEAREKDQEEDKAQSDQLSNSINTALAKILETMQQDRQMMAQLLVMLAKPKSRTGIVELPTGKVKMTVREEMT